jgi:hypothetical protein
VYFLIAAAAPNVRQAPGKVSIAGIDVGVSTAPAKGGGTRPERVANAASEAFDEGQPLATGQRDSALKEIASAPRLMQPFLKRAVEDPAGFKRGLAETMPRTLFVLLPIFAGIVALFYHGRKYPEHLYFAIHLHAFIFLALAMTQLLKFTRVTALAGIGGAVAFVWIPIYATLALRRVYGGSVGKTLAKEVGIGAIYLFVSGIALAVMIYWVSVAT